MHIDKKGTWEGIGNDSEIDLSQEYRISTYW